MNLNRHINPKAVSRGITWIILMSRLFRALFFSLHFESPSSTSPVASKSSRRKNIAFAIFHGSIPRKISIRTSSSRFPAIAINDKASTLSFVYFSLLSFFQRQYGIVDSSCVAEGDAERWAAFWHLRRLLTPCWAVIRDFLHRPPHDACMRGWQQLVTLSNELAVHILSLRPPRGREAF